MMIMSRGIMESLCVFLLLSLFFASSAISMDLTSNDLNSLPTEYSRAEFISIFEISKEFAAGFIHEYRDVLQKEIAPQFLDSIPLARGNYTINIIASTECESFISIQPSHKLLHTYSVSDWPIQVHLFSGLDSLVGRGEVDTIVAYTLNRYKLIPPTYSITDSNVIFTTDVTFVSYLAKQFTFGKNSLIFLENGKFAIRRNKRHVVETTLNGFSFLTGDSDFSYFTNLKERYGQLIAEQQMRNLFFSSRYFREVRGYKLLAPLAGEMLIKQEKARNGLIDYPFYQFNAERLELRKKIYELGLDDKFEDDLFNDGNIRPHIGNLFVPYTSRVGFMVQWIVINSSMFILLFIVKLKANKRLLTIKEFLINSNHKFLVISVISGVNGWVWMKIPNNFTIWYMAIPGLLYIATISFVYSGDNKQNLS